MVMTSATVAMFSTLHCEDFYFYLISASSAPQNISEYKKMDEIAVIYATC